MHPVTKASPATLPAPPRRSYRAAPRFCAPLLCRRFTASGLLLATALLFAGCDVRLETPPPAEPVPDAIELVRRTVAADAERIAQLSAIAAVGEESEAVREELLRINADARAHLASVGGIYVSGLSLPDDNVEAEAALPQNATVAEVLSELNRAAHNNISNAVGDPNGNKARLFASIGISQGLAAERLAAASGVENPDPITNWYGLEGEAELGSPDGHEATGITVADFQAIVKSEDAARYAFEVAAARSEGDLRAAFRHRARLHGARAQAWAALGQIAETDQDPRLVAYQIPLDIPPAELVLLIENGLSLRWAALIAAAAPGARSPLVEALVASQQTVAQWGGSVAAFPGIPELEGSFGSAATAPDAPRIPYEWAAELPEEPHEGPE